MIEFVPVFISSSEHWAKKHWQQQHWCKKLINNLLTTRDLFHFYFNSADTMNSSIITQISVAGLLLAKKIPIEVAAAPWQDGVIKARRMTTGSTSLSSISLSPTFSSLNIGSIRKGQPPKTENPTTSPTVLAPLLHPSLAPNETSVPSFHPSFDWSLEDVITYQPSLHPSLSPLVPIPALEHTQFTVTETPSKALTSNPDMTKTETNPYKGTVPIASNHPTNSPSIHQKQESDFESLKFYRNQLFSPICTLFFPDRSILDEQSVHVFETTIEDFVAMHSDEINLPVVIVDVKGVTVVSQVLSWKKRPSRILRSEGAVTGLDVYFRIDVVATGYATKDELEYSFQELFDSNNDMFQGTVDLNAMEASPFNPTQLTLVTVVGCSGIVALLFTISIFVWRKRSGENQLPSPKPAKKKPKSAEKPEYPMQESRQLALDNVSPNALQCFFRVSDDTRVSNCSTSSGIKFRRQFK